MDKKAVVSTMPEGDTIYRTAVTLRKALVGTPLLMVETTVPQVQSVLDKIPVEGWQVEAIYTLGKHLIVLLRDPAASSCSVAVPVRLGSTSNLDILDADLALHTHMQMTGSWHIYRPGEVFKKPRRLARVVLHTASFVAPCFSAPTVELLTGRELMAHEQLASLGPDAITDEFDTVEVRMRLKRHPNMAIAVALLNQTILCGVGNIYKSEALFIQRLSPFISVSSLSDAQLDSLIAECHRLLMKNRSNTIRTTLDRPSKRHTLWVYGRGGRPCIVCSSTIQMRRQGEDARTTYFCQVCQRA